MLIRKLCRIIEDYFYERKMAKQRAKRKYSDDMCWGIDYTLLEILPPMIEQMRKAKHGYPELEFEEVLNFPIQWINKEMKNLQKEFKEKDYEEPDINDPFTKWQLILKRIVFCLTEADEDKTSFKNQYDEEYDKQLWSNIKNENNLKEYFVPVKYDENNKPKLYKFNTHKVDEELSKKWLNTEEEIWEYRDNMKTEAFNLINEYFWTLWD